MVPIKHDDAQAADLGLETGLAPLNPTETAPVPVPGAAGGDDFTVDAATLLGSEGAAKRRVPLETIIIAGVVLVAGGVLYGMRLIGVSPQSALAGDTASLRLPERPKTADPKLLLEDLAAARTSRQVPSERVKKNPFQLIGMTLIPTTPDEGEAASLAQIRADRERTEKAKVEQAKKIEDEFKRFELVAVIGGSQPVARINGGLYRVGDKVGEFHTLKNINSLQRSVELEVNGQTVTLSLPTSDHR